MFGLRAIILSLLLFASGLTVYSQPDEGQTGAWYMYFWSADIGESRWGFQGDKQFRNWNLMGDLEQLLLRGGLTFRPKDTRIKLTQGYAFILTSTPGESTESFSENRIYQELLAPQQVGRRVYLLHRYRLEQRWVEGQRFRGRIRYNIFVNIPFNQETLDRGAIYLALYNELFINLNRDIGEGREVALFDRNRTYAALGYSLSKKLRLQLGYMRQITNEWNKGQIQLSAHHNF